jgi:hypothetical protein
MIAGSSPSIAAIPGLTGFQSAWENASGNLSTLGGATATTVTTLPVAGATGVAIACS